LTMNVTAAAATARKIVICRPAPDVKEVGTLNASAAALGATCPHKPIVGTAACAATAAVLGAAAVRSVLLRAAVRACKGALAEGATNA
jgi:hypothetical protein